MKTLKEKNHNNKFVKCDQRGISFNGKQDLNKQLKNSLGHPFGQGSF